jgi:ABC-2 type transport system ATP-binding protein
MSDDIAIKIDHISKRFVLPHERSGSVKSAVTNFYRKNKTSYEDQNALKDISFEVKKGEFFGIVGRNGSGKSTLLKLIAGIYQPTSGSVSVKGKLVPFIELGVGFNPELTGRENVYLNGAMLGFSRKQIADMYDDIVAFAEIERFMDQKLKNYSSGMQVRLAFSMATRSNADILLVDEVLAVGDADFQRKCFDYFRALKGAKKTVVFVTHDMNAVREYCDRAVLIEKSQLVESGTASKIASKYTRMFVEKATADSEDPKQKDKRWGDGRLRMANIKVESKRMTDDDKELVFGFDVTATEATDKPIFGFLIKSATHMPLMGTNNAILKTDIAHLDAGETIHVEWRLPNVFNEGIHYIDPAVVYDSGNRVADWWEEAISFRVAREDKTPYPVNPPITVNIIPGSKN